VLLSGRGEPEAQACEEIVKNSGLEWTVLRCSWFNQNFSENYLLEPILAGEVALPVADVREPFVDADDIADAAVAALMDDKHVGQLYELTGPQLLTFAEAIEQIARASGRKIRYVHIPMDEYVAALEQAQLPADLIALIKYLFSEVLDGRNAYLADGVQSALGRAPTEFGEYVRRAAASGAWRG
ncbi:MAG TPA: NmrA family NAD(P)-binding protein, partial [Steroidobacteraceae bacterium]|nr:NmrA family NAD(P)-binding protein [Steroidobacteraceae bacterium]